MRFLLPVLVVFWGCEAATCAEHECASGTKKKTEVDGTDDGGAPAETCCEAATCADYAVCPVQYKKNSAGVETLQGNSPMGACCEFDREMTVLSVRGEFKFTVDAELKLVGTAVTAMLAETLAVLPHDISIITSTGGAGGSFRRLEAEEVTAIYSVRYDELVKAEAALQTMKNLTAEAAAAALKTALQGAGVTVGDGFTVTSAVEEQLAGLSSEGSSDTSAACQFTMVVVSAAVVGVCGL
mmetsp:Transcript_77826/g.178164  ORF Transcript_77826/g.178164 Transcript_77826/m.178164 type:complete len:240 (+) Transcript_77826:66-785(+)